MVAASGCRKLRRKPSRLHEPGLHSAKDVKHGSFVRMSRRDSKHFDTYSADGTGVPTRKQILSWEILGINKTSLRKCEYYKIWFA